MRFMSIYCSGALMSAEINGATTSPHCRRSQSAAAALILRKRECENHAAINQRDSVQTAPTKHAPCGPINLIAKQIRDGDPKQAGKNQQVSKDRYKQTACLVTQEGRVEQWLRSQQTKNSKSAHGKKFSYETQYEPVADGQRNEQGTPERGEFPHLNGSEQPERPGKTNG
jgi:hypothetical protein